MIKRIIGKEYLTVMDGKKQILQLPIVKVTKKDIFVHRGHVSVVKYPLSECSYQ